MGELGAALVRQSLVAPQKVWASLAPRSRWSRSPASGERGRSRASGEGLVKGMRWECQRVKVGCKWTDVQQSGIAWTICLFQMRDIRQLLSIVVFMAAHRIFSTSCSKLNLYGTLG